MLEHGCVTTSLVDCFLRYVTESDRVILESCRSHFEDVDKEDLFEVMDHHNCRRVPTAGNIEQLLEEIAHQKLMFVIEQWHDVLAPMRFELQDIAAAYDELQPTSRKLMKSTAYPATMNVQQKQTGRYLKPRSDCQPKSDFCANPIEIRSYLNSLNGNELHEIRFVQIRFELHSYVVWNPIQIAFLEIRFSLDGQIGFSIAFSCSHAT